MSTDLKAKAGLEDVVATTSAICFIDGDRGILSYRGYDIHDLARPAHTLLLGAGIPICEHLTHLRNVPREGGFLHAVPIAWRGGATFPVRAYVMVDYNSSV